MTYLNVMYMVLVGNGESEGGFFWFNLTFLKFDPYISNAPSYSPDT